MYSYRREFYEGIGDACAFAGGRGNKPTAGKDVPSGAGGRFCAHISRRGVAATVLSLLLCSASSLTAGYIIDGGALAAAGAQSPAGVESPAGEKKDDLEASFVMSWVFDDEPGDEDDAANDIAGSDVESSGANAGGEGRNGELAGDANGEDADGDGECAGDANGEGADGSGANADGANDEDERFESEDDPGRISRLAEEYIAAHTPGGAG